MIGDQLEGVTRKYTFTFMDGKPLPPNLRANRTPAMPYRADAPLRASGLIGPVKIERERPAAQ